MSEIFQFINTSMAQGRGRYTVAAHTEITISKTNVGGKKILAKVTEFWCSMPSVWDQTPGKITASAL